MKEAVHDVLAIQGSSGRSALRPSIGDKIIQHVAQCEAASMSPHNRVLVACVFGKHLLLVGYLSNADQVVCIVKIQLTEDLPPRSHLKATVNP